MVFYKIRDKKTGLYSTGGSMPGWNRQGKCWSGIGYAKSSITSYRYYRRHYPTTADPTLDGEIVRFECVEVETAVFDVKGLGL